MNNEFTHLKHQCSKSLKVKTSLIRIFKFTTSLATLVIVSSCATPTPYQPLGEYGGYKSDQISARDYIVTFNGNGYSTQEQTYKYALRRAAEITQEKGFKYFTVTKSKDLSGSTTTNHGAISSLNYGYIQHTPITATVFRPNTELTIRCYNQRPNGVSNVFTANQITSQPIE